MHWFFVVFTIIGVLSLVGVILALFSSWGQRPSKLWSTGLPHIASDDFARAISKACNADVGAQHSRPQLFNNGDEFYPAILKDLAHAKKSINFMVYICESGEITNQMLDVLIDRAKNGVDVRILLDGIGSRNAPEDKLAELERSGGKVGRFRPFSIAKLARLYKRNHRRAIIVDGSVGWIGGAAFADHWMGNAQDAKHWRDSMVRVEGAMVSDVQSAFVQVWADNQGEVLVGKRYYPELRKGDQDIDSSVRFADTDMVRYVSVVSSPTHEMHPLSRFFWLSFASAKKRIYITHAYFMPIRDIRDILCAQARNGVDVRIILPDEHNDVPLVRWASHRLYDKLLSSGVKVYEYQPTMVHAKHVVVDGEWSIVGSSNLDMRSLHLNKENVFGILDKGFANELETVFEKDLEQAKEITLQEWRKRPWWHRIFEQLTYLLEEQF